MANPVSFWLNRDPRTQVASVLALVMFAALSATPTLISVATHLLVIIFVVVALDLLITLAVRNKLFVPRSALVTGLLITLILDPTTPLWLSGLTSAVAILSKHTLKINARHIFNPAAFGLIASSLLFQAPVSWWGVSGNPWSLFLLAVGMAVILTRVRLKAIPLGFLAIYGVYLIVKFSAVLAVTRLIDPTIFLFALVMIPEPKTSPMIYPWRSWHGIVVAIGLIGLLELFKTALDPLLLALLLGNLVAVLVFNRLRPKPQPVVEATQ